MQLTADQSNYGPARDSLEPGEERRGQRECVSLGGTREWRVPGSPAANCHCFAVITFGVDHGAELPLSSRVGAGDVM